VIIEGAVSLPESRLSGTGFPRIARKTDAAGIAATDLAVARTTGQSDAFTSTVDRRRLLRRYIATEHRMTYAYRYLFPGLWLAWALYWLAASGNVKENAWREPPVSRLLHIVPLTLAAVLLFPDRSPVQVLGGRFLPVAAWPFWFGALLTASGILLAVWARVHLGANWSSTVTVKQGHELIVSGPYRFVRHPIYSGLLLAFVGSALARAQWRGVLAVAIVFCALWRKSRIEEQRMHQQFGTAYEQYASRVRALVPYVVCITKRPASRGRNDMRAQRIDAPPGR
jgi:protein-S-isoprenylcysteine O-methyltransferase Ste14